MESKSKGINASVSDENPVEKGLEINPSPTLDIQTSHSLVLNQPSSMQSLHTNTILTDIRNPNICTYIHNSYIHTKSLHTNTILTSKHKPYILT